MRNHWSSVNSRHRNRSEPNHPTSELNRAMAPPNINIQARSSRGNKRLTQNLGQSCTLNIKVPKHRSNKSSGTQWPSGRRQSDRSWNSEGKVRWPQSSLWSKINLQSCWKWEALNTNFLLMKLKLDMLQLILRAHQIGYCPVRKIIQQPKQHAA